MALALKVIVCLAMAYSLDDEIAVADAVDVVVAVGVVEPQQFDEVLLLESK